MEGRVRVKSQLTKVGGTARHVGIPGLFIVRGVISRRVNPSMRLARSLLVRENLPLITPLSWMKRVRENSVAFRVLRNTPNLLDSSKASDCLG